MLFVAYVMAAIVLTIVILCKADSEEAFPQLQKHEIERPADKL